MAYTDHIHVGFSEYTAENGVLLLKVPAIEQTGHYIHGFSTRRGGISPGPHASLNLSLTREENRANVAENYHRLAAALAVDPAHFAACHYEHGNGVALLTSADRGQGIWHENTLPFCDGVVVNTPDVVAVTLHADCTPLFFADRHGRAAGVAHAGWKGTYHAISENMIDHLGVAPEDILVGIGPNIKVCCFEVQEDVGGLFVEKYGDSVRIFRDGKQYVDLVAVTLQQLERKGILPEHVTVSDYCTYCRHDLFFSHRHSHGNTGAMASVIALRP